MSSASGILGSGAPSIRGDWSILSLMPVTDSNLRSCIVLPNPGLFGWKAHPALHTADPAWRPAISGLF